MAVKFCSSCGTQLNANAKFCTSCGAQQDVSADGRVSVCDSSVVENSTSYYIPESDRYNVMLTECGGKTGTAAEIVRDTCGYSLAEAQKIVNNLPTLVAYNVTLTQARCICANFNNNGMTADVYDADGSTPSDYADSTLYTSTVTDSGTAISIGGVLTGIASVLATLTQANRIGHEYIQPYAQPPRRQSALPELPPKKRRTVVQPRYTQEHREPPRSKRGPERSRENGHSGGRRGGPGGGI